MPITRRQLLAVGLAAVGLAAVPRLGTPARDEGITGQELRDAKIYLDLVQPEYKYIAPGWPKEFPHLIPEPALITEEYALRSGSGYIVQQMLAERGIRDAQLDALLALSENPRDRIIHAPNPDEIWLRFNGEDAT